MTFRAFRSAPIYSTIRIHFRMAFKPPHCIGAGSFRFHPVGECKVVSSFHQCGSNSASFYRFRDNRVNNIKIITLQAVFYKCGTIVDFRLEQFLFGLMSNFVIHNVYFKVVQSIVTDSYHSHDVRRQLLISFLYLPAVGASDSISRDIYRYCCL